MKQKYGRVVNLSSIVGLRGNAGQANYAASKAGLIGLTKSMAKELAGRNVTVNAVGPRFYRYRYDSGAPRKGAGVHAGSIPMGRLGQGEDVAKAVAFFAGDGAGYVTGQVLCVDGRHGRINKEETMEKRRVVITGMGAVTPLGLTVEESWLAVRAGTCGIAPITLYDTSGMKAKLAGEVKGFEPADYMEKREARKMDRFAQFALAAAGEAVAQSGLEFSAEDPYRCGLIVSCGIGGLTTMQHECAKGEAKGYDRISPFFIPMAIGNMAAAQIAIKYGITGMATCPTTACAGGTNAVGDALRQVRDGYADVVLCGGAEAVVNELAMGGFTSMHALSTAEEPDRASIPFDAARSGFVMGEGAGILVLEELKHARRRRAPILAEVVGYGATCDAHHITAPGHRRRGSRPGA